MNKQLDSEFMDNMDSKMKNVQILTDLIADNFDMSRKDAFYIALSPVKSLSYKRELKLRSLLK